jgi:hypothetical protein
MNQPQHDLARIRQLMEESQRTVDENGKHFLLWGALGTVGLVATWVFVVGRSTLDPRWVWAGVLGVGWVASVWLGLRSDARARVRTAGRRVVAAVWVSCAVTMTLIGVAGMAGPVVGMPSLSGLIASVMALGLASTGVLTGLRWLVWVGVAWWVGAAVMLFVPGSYTLLLLAGMTLLLEVVPGALLYARSREQAGGAVR